MITHHFDTKSKQMCQLPCAQLLYASIVNSQQISQANRCDNHSHIFTELIYVLEGSGWLEVENNRVELHPGEVLILNPQTSHRNLQPESDDFSVMMLGMYCSYAANFQSAAHQLVGSHSSPGLVTCIQLFCEELKNQQESFESACQQLAQLILLQMNRLYPLMRTTLSNRKSSLECTRVRQFIDEHFSEPITLDQLAAYAGLNKYYLVHVFNREMGCSPISYLIERRITESKRLLSTTTISVQQISSRLGFSSPSYFSQSFRRATGFSPVEFRRQILAAKGAEPAE